MNTNILVKRARSLVSQFARCAIVAASFFAAKANAETIYGVTVFRDLVTFDSANPGTILTTKPITGLTSQDQFESVRKIDFRPATGQLYAVGNAPGGIYRLYTIDINNGKATRIGAPQLLNPISGSFGFNFEPLFDQIRIVTDDDQNLGYDPSTAALVATGSPLAYVSGDVNFGVNPTIVTASFTTANSNGFMWSIDRALGVFAYTFQDEVNQGKLRTGPGNAVGIPLPNYIDGVNLEISQETQRLYVALSDPGTGHTNLYEFKNDNSGLILLGEVGSGLILNSIAITLPVSAPTGASLPATTFLVNGSATPTFVSPDSVIRFEARQTSNAAGVGVRVQASTDPGNESSWLELDNGNKGHMVFDTSINRWALNATNYPHQGGLYFRAITDAQGYVDSKSDPIGPFNLASGAQHLPATRLLLFDQIATGSVRAATALRLNATQTSNAAGLAVRIQISTTPNNEGSWTDLNDGNGGKMTNDSAGEFSLLTTAYPTGSAVYFRAISSASGNVDSISNFIGPVTLVQVTPPSVTITPPPGDTGSGSGQDLAHPIILKQNSSGFVTFNFGASATSNRSIKRVTLFIDGGTVDHTDSSSATAEFSTSVSGMHELRAAAVDDLGALGEANPIYVLVHPAGGKVFLLINQGRRWHEQDTWRDLAGQPGIPGAKDLALVGSGTVLVTENVSVFAVVLDHGTIGGNVPDVQLSILGLITINGGQVDQIGLTIDRFGACALTGDDDVVMTGTVTNFGTFKILGNGGITGKEGTPSRATTQAGGIESVAVPSGPFDFIGAIVRNVGNFLFKPPKKASSSSSKTASRKQVVTVSNFRNEGTLKFLSDDGAGLIGHDGATIITHDGASIITHDGASIKIQGRTSNASSNVRAATAAAAYTQASGETDLSFIRIIAPVNLDGGVIIGSGVIEGDVINNGGFISPGHSAGVIHVTGSYSQGANGSLVLEVGGANGNAVVPEFDQLQISGSATLGGNLVLKTINGFTPDPNATFVPLGYSSANGNFASTSGNVQVTLASTGTNMKITGANPPAPKALNIATRMRVEAGDNALIGGFIITGSASKKVIIRGLGPSTGVSGALADTTLELHKADGSTFFNDNWRDSQEAEIIATTIPPTNNFESAIVASLPPGGHTAIVRGKGGSTGVGLVEVYDLEGAAPETLANISTRGQVQTGDNVMIGGFIIGGNQPAKILVRAIGPSLTALGIAGALQDPVLELHDKNGTMIANDDWRSTQEAEIIATTVPPTHIKEAAILATLVPDPYTAIVRGANNTIGIALVEAYNIQ